MTTDISTPITLPGKLAGVLTVRRCSPVVHETIDHEDWDDGDDPPLVKVRAVIGLLRHGGALASVSYEQSGVPLQEDEVPVGELELDLEAKTGRAHAAWWAGDAESSRRPDASASVPDGYFVEDAGDFGVRVTIYRRCNARVYTGTEVPALGKLNLYGPAPLPDGSSRAEALALQAVCLHIGGQR